MSSLSCSSETLVPLFKLSSKKDCLVDIKSNWFDPTNLNLLSWPKQIYKFLLSKFMVWVIILFKGL